MKQPELSFKKVKAMDKRGSVKRTKWSSDVLISSRNPLERA